MGALKLSDLVAAGLVLAGLGYTVATLDKLGLVVAFGGVTLLARDVLRDSPSDRERPS